MRVVRVLQRFKKRLRAVLHAAFGEGGADAAYPTGHFYNPVPLIDDMARRQTSIFGPWPDTLDGIDLNPKGQLEWLQQLARYYPEQPFDNRPTDGLRYGFDNPFFCQSDALFLYGMIRHLQPSRIVEVGSGHSSAVILDTLDRFDMKEVDCTFIEPYPERLYSLLTDADRQRVTVHEQIVQQVPRSVFAELTAGDILFIDSSHVVKTGSDVAHLLFEVLPCLAPGVVVHFHDLFYPFEYPQAWVNEGRSWNEAYFLRAFLSGNDQYEIIAFTTWLAHFHESELARQMPRCLENTGGSLWLRKSGAS